MRRIISLLCLVWIHSLALAQEAEDISVDSVEVVQGVDIFGQAVLFAEGQLLNQSAQAFTNISLLAEVYDADDNLIGEGFGFPVNACGAGLLPDFALQPGLVQPFSVPLELYEEEVTIDRVEILPQAEVIEPVSAAPQFLPGIIQVSRREVVNVEWIDENALRFGSGCWRDVFNGLTWIDYNLGTGIQQSAEHPKAELITEALRRQLGLLEDIYYDRSFLSYDPNGRRLVYQTELNAVITAEPDGSFKRVLFQSGLSNRSLQGIQWLTNGRFLAYYYGAYGDPVLYFTASADGQVISEPPTNNLPSLTTPGASPDGLAIIITAEADGQTGYYLKRAPFPGTELLFESDIPGNNWPGPLYSLDANGAAFIYVALPVDDEAHLFCFNRTSGELTDLSPLPISLTSDERGWWWMSPDNTHIALAANGLNGGLWLIELDTLGACA